MESTHARAPSNGQNVNFLFPVEGLSAFWRSHGRWTDPAALSARRVPGRTHHPQHHLPVQELHQVRTRWWETSTVRVQFDNTFTSSFLILFFNNFLIFQSFGQNHGGWVHGRGQVHRGGAADAQRSDRVLQTARLWAGTRGETSSPPLSHQAARSLQRGGENGDKWRNQGHIRARGEFQLLPSFPVILHVNDLERRFFFPRECWLSCPSALTGWTYTTVRPTLERWQGRRRAQRGKTFSTSSMSSWVRGEKSPAE